MPEGSLVHKTPMRDMPAVHPGRRDWAPSSCHVMHEATEHCSQHILHAAAAAGWPADPSRLSSHQAPAYTPAMEGSQGTPVVGSHDSPRGERDSGGQPLQLPRASPPDDRDHEDARGMPPGSSQDAGVSGGQGGRSGSKAQSDGERWGL